MLDLLPGGMSVREIPGHPQGLCGVDIERDTISRVATCSAWHPRTPPHLDAVLGATHTAQVSLLHRLRPHYHLTATVATYSGHAASLANRRAARASPRSPPKPPQDST